MRVVVGHSDFFLTKREWHFPMASFIFVNLAFHDSKEFEIIAAEAYVVIIGACVENVFSDSFLLIQQSCCDFEPVGARHQFIRLKWHLVCCELRSKQCHHLKVHCHVALLRVSVHQRGQGMSVLIWSTPAKDVGPTALVLAHL